MSGKCIGPTQEVPILKGDIALFGNGIEWNQRIYYKILSEHLKQNEISLGRYPKNNT